MREAATTGATGMVPKQGQKGHLSIPLDRLPREEVSLLMRSWHGAFPNEFNLGRRLATPEVCLPGGEWKTQSLRAASAPHSAEAPGDHLERDSGVFVHFSYKIAPLSEMSESAMREL